MLLPQQVSILQLQQSVQKYQQCHLNLSNVAPTFSPRLQLRMDHDAHTVEGYLSPNHRRARPILDD